MLEFLNGGVAVPTATFRGFVRVYQQPDFPTVVTLEKAEIINAGWTIAPGGHDNSAIRTRH